jgi:AraC-like DNA-binding protein
LRVGRTGPETHIISGLFELDAWSSKPLLELLPRVICVRSDQANTGALGATLDLLAVEAAGQAIGSPIVTSRLAEILFIQCIRAHHATAGAEEMGWLSALGDPQLGAALRAMHQAPARPWSVGALAAVAGMSRSAFAPRFKARVGETPLGYLTRWRMYKAGCALREGDEGIAAIARSVGYESTGAFNRVFQRTHGQTPGAFRRERRRA